MSNFLPASILEIFGLDDKDTQSVSFQKLEDGTTVLEVYLVPHPHRCPRCGYDHPVSHGYIQKMITHSVLAGKRCALKYMQRRWRCPVCQKTWSEDNPFVFKKQKLSKKTVQNILDALKSPAETFSSVAQRFSLSPSTVVRIFDEHIIYPKPSTLPEILLIDEVYACKSDMSGYVCVLLDYQNAQPVDLLDNRRQETLIKYFMGFPLSERNKVKFVSTDMFAPYRTVCKKCFKNAKLAIDKFHVVQDFGRKLTAVRCRIMHGYSSGSDEYYLLKKQNHLLQIPPAAKVKGEDGKYTNEFVFDPERSREKNRHFHRYLNQYELRKMLLDISPELEEAWKIKNKLSDFYRSETLETAPDKLRELISLTENAQASEIRDFSSTLKRWFPEIINSFEVISEEYFVNADPEKGKVKKIQHHLTSGMIESRNKVLKDLKRFANGYMNFSRFRNRGLYVLKKDPPFQEEEKKEDEKKEPNSGSSGSTKNNN